MAIYSGFSHLKWWFSIVMLVYQRVYSSTKQTIHDPNYVLNPRTQWEVLWANATRHYLRVTVGFGMIWGCPMFKQNRSNLLLVSLVMSAISNLFCWSRTPFNVSIPSVCQSTWKPFVHRSKSQCFVSNAFKCWIWVRPQSMWFINVSHFPCFSRKLPTILHSSFPGLKDMCCTPIFLNVLSSYSPSDYIKMSINGA